MNPITLSRDQATRLLHSLQHLHTLHGPCDGPTCPHAAVLRELEGLIYLASAREDTLNEAYVRFQRSLNADPEFQAVAPFQCQDPHDLADALLRATTSPASYAQSLERAEREPYIPTPCLCAACGATLPSTTSEGTNLCGRCAL